MKVEIDPIREVVRRGDETWPIELDCRNWTAAVEVAGRGFSLRPLLWREKRGLARFAHLGEAFLQKHFVKLCLTETQPWPEDPAHQEVLLALARWINTPDPYQTALPLDVNVLAMATLEVCRALNLASSDLDGREAGEVEMFWRAVQAAAREEPGTPVQASDNVTVIKIVADETGEGTIFSPEGRRLTEALKPESESPPSGPNVRPAQGAGSSEEPKTGILSELTHPRASKEQTPVRIRPPVGPDHREPISTQGRVTLTPATDRSARFRVAAPQVSQVAASVKQAGRPRLAFKVSPGSASPAREGLSRGLAGLRANPEETPESQFSEDARLSLSSPESAGDQALGPSYMDAPLKVVLPLPAFQEPARGVKGPAQGPEAGLPTFTAAVPSVAEPDLLEPSPEPQDALLLEQRNALWEELAERLEQAAADMGIDIEV